MADPFQNVDAAGPEFIKIFADAMDERQSDPAMEKIVVTYLATLNVPDDGLVVEMGAGAGAVSRRIAAHVHPARVMGYEPSAGFVAEARERGKAHSNLEFAVADGTQIPHDDGSVDVVIMHTVLTHVETPETLIEETKRLLKPGGELIICDADFSKSTFSAFPNDPLDICAREFVREFVTDAYFVAKMRSVVSGLGFEVISFDADSRVVSNTHQMLPWVDLTTRNMCQRGEIGQGLADALVAEYKRRADAGSLYGYQVFATLLARKPD